MIEFKKVYIHKKLLSFVKVVASIEARMGSSRLPGKTMKKILDKSMLELMIERIKNCKMIDQIIIATSNSKNDDIIENLAQKLSVTCFRGSEDDVLERVLCAVQSVDGEIIVELWGDTPLIDPFIIDKMVKFFLDNKYDCVGTVLPNFEKSYPLGISALIFPTKILDEVEKITQNPDDRENVSNYIYEHPQQYKLAPLPCPPELNYPELRLVVDEADDFELIKIIFEHFYPENPKFSTLDIINFLNENPHLLEINKHVQQKRLQNWDKL